MSRQSIAEFKRYSEQLTGAHERAAAERGAAAIRDMVCAKGLNLHEYMQLEAFMSGVALFYLANVNKALHNTSAALGRYLTEEKL